MYALFPRVAEDQSEVHSGDFIGSRFFDGISGQIHRANAAEIAAIVRLHSGLAGDCRSHYRRFRQEAPRLTIRPARRTASRLPRQQLRTSNFAHRWLTDDEATAYHEGIPGHHMQLSVQQQMTSLPKVSASASGNSGYIEGVELYSEQLGK